MSIAAPERDEIEIELEKDTGSGTPTSDPLSRWFLAVFGAGFLGLTFAQSWGLIEDDSKLSLILSPLRVMASALHVWNEQVFGGVASQNGLVFPMGPFFALTQALHVPAWCAERVWLALLLTVGLWGVVRLAEALGIGTRGSRVIAGLAYCATPIVVTWAQASAFLLVVVLLPWVLIPLVHGSREGSPRRAAARSGVAIALMGAANAALTLTVLPLAVIWLLTRKPGPGRRRLLLWWLLAAGMACFWWAVSLNLAGKYAFNYLPYTETSATTTQTTSIFESLRGASSWLDYLSLDSPLLPGAWTLVSSSIVILATSVLTALGLVGLCRRIPERLFLVASMSFGVLVIAAGFSGSLGAPFSLGVQHLLQTGLEPFRNVSKFAPDVALPLVMGLAWTLSSNPWGDAKHATQEAGKWVSKISPDASYSLAAVRVLAVAAIVLAAAPFWQQNLYQSGGISGIPRYWSQAGQWLDTHQGNENALLVPGSSFASYTWGYTGDQPLRVASDTSIEWRNLIPVGSNGYIQMLSAVESVLDSGTTAPGLSEYLSRGGIKYVVEQNDLNLKITGAPPPAQVHQVLSETNGLKEVASFGPKLAPAQVAYGSLPVYDSPADLRLRAVEIYEVNPSPSIVQSYPVSDPVVVSGGVGSLLPLSSEGVVDGHASVLSGDSLARGASLARKATLAITDGNQRRITSFGSVRLNTSYLLAAGQELSKPVAGVPSGFTVVPGTQHQTVELPVGAASVAASSFGSTPLLEDPSDGPSAAFDGNPTTAWVANATNRSVGQWVSITFKHPISLSTIRVTPLVGTGRRQPAIRKVTISTDRGSVVRNLPATKSPVRLRVPHGPSRYLRITIDSTRGGFAIPVQGRILLGAGITNVAIPGVSYAPQMLVPNDESAAFSGPRRNPPVVVFDRPIANPNISLGQNPTDDPSMARVFETPKSMAAEVSGFVVPSQGDDLENLLTQLTPSSGFSVSASSSLGNLPRFRPENLVDASAAPWIAGTTDSKPSIELKWSNPQHINAISLGLSPQASRPTKISITDSAGSRLVRPVPKKGGTIAFPTLVTDSLKIRFIEVATKLGESPNYDVGLPLPVGLQSMTLSGLRQIAAPNPDAPVDLACGQGPPVVIDGVVLPTTVAGNVGDLLDFKPMLFSACLPPAGLKLGAGKHTFEQGFSQAPFEITSVLMHHVSSSQAPSVPRKTEVEKWNNDSRKVAIGSGPASYLVVAQNYNNGWVAKLGNQTLQPIRIDGWQQGYVVPAGAGGTVTLVMAPENLYRILLVLGAMLLLGLAVLALVPSRKASRDPTGPRPLPSFWVLLVGSLIVLGLVAGPLALLALPLLLVAKRWGSGAMAATAFLAFVGAGVAAAWDPAHLFSTGAGAFSAQAQVASVLALAAVLVSVVVDRRGSRKREAISASQSQS